MTDKATKIDFGAGAKGVADPQNGRGESAPTSPETHKATKSDLLLCPKCEGQGHVIKPPWVPGDVPSWMASSTVSYVCPVCQGAKVVTNATTTSALRAALLKIASAPPDRVTAGFLIELAKDALRDR